MNLSIYDLKNMKKQCDDFSDCIKLILKEKYTNSSDTPFNSLSDYENAIDDKLTRPELYYKVQIFNHMTYISYRKNTKMYHIVTKGFYSEKLNKYKRYSNSEDSYIISSDFEETLKIWYDIIIDCISILKPQQEFIF